MLDKETLSQLLIRGHQLLNTNIKKYNDLNTDSKKIVLLSSLFTLNLYIKLEYLDNLFTQEHKTKINMIINDHKLDYNSVRIYFYFSSNKPCTCVSYHHLKEYMKIPTKIDNLFKGLEEINLTALENMIINSDYTLNRDNVSKYNIVIETYNLLIDCINKRQSVRKKELKYK